MTDRHIRHVPVLDAGDRVIGLITLGDVGKAIIAQQEFTIAHLEHYVAGAEAAQHRTA